MPKPYTMSAAATAQRQAAAKAGAAKHPGGKWATVRLRAQAVARIDKARGRLSRAEYLHRLAGG